MENGNFVKDLQNQAQLEDSFKHKGLRQKMIDEIRGKEIKDESVLKAMGKIPRHLFMDSGFSSFAYQDKAFPIAAGQTISQPYTVAFQTQALRISRQDKVLEVGTGSGYQAAVLCEMGASLYTIERQRALYDFARKLLPKLGYNPHFFWGDGYAGLPTYGPFDKIIVTAGAEEIPQQLAEQLAVGGIMVVPVGRRESQSMKIITRKDAATFTVTDGGNFVFVPMLPGVAENGAS